MVGSTRFVAGLLCACALVSACGGGGDATPTPTPTQPTPVLTTVVVTLSSATLSLGQTATATASGLDQNGAAISLGQVTWSTSPSSVASITASGAITAVAAGQTQVIATVGGKQGQATLTVTAPPPAPAPVATITVAPPSVNVSAGATQQLTATTLDASGNVLTGRVVSWTTSNAAVATVSASGLVTAVAAGTATITATSEGKTANVVVTVTAPVVPVATVTVAPGTASILVGGTQQLTATTRDAAGNVLSGRAVAWTTSNAAVATVNANGLVTGVAAGTATITATSEGRTGTAVITVTAPAPVCSAGTALQLALGEVRVLTAAQKASLCLGGASATEYVLIPFNTSTVAASQTQIDIAGTGTSAITSPAPQRIPAGLLASRLPGSEQSMEAAFRERERRDLAGVTARVSSSRALRLTGIPTNPIVGAVYQLNSSISGNLCSAKTLHPARVVAVLPHTIVFIDTLAPAGGYTNAELTAFGTSFDTLGFALDTLNFGAPTDIDGNTRIGIFFTPGVNQIPGPTGGFVAGLFASRDLFSATGAGNCAGSNEGEMFYMPVPDPNRTINGNYANKTTLANGVLGTLVHEFQHLINAGRRIYVNGAASASEEIWLNEGLSHIAEELLYYRVSGNSPRSNISLATLQSSQAQVDAYNTFQNQNFGRLGNYLAAPSANSPYAQTDGFEMRGAIWQLLRYSADRKGGVERSTWFALVNSTQAGLANFNAVFGDIVGNTRDWAVAQFTDDAGLGVPAIYTHPSWNFRSIYPALTSPSRFPLATVALIGGTPVSVVLVGGGAAYVRFRVAAGVFATVAGTSSSQPVPAAIDFILVRTQ